MSTELAIKQDEQFAIVEQMMISGDLARLTPPQRVQYYNRVCESLGLNPYTKPFSYITLNGKLQLYALKDCAEQLRHLRRISITHLDKQFVDDLYIVTASASTPDGRTDQSTGAVSVAGLKGEQKANAIMKAETKAKRRVTLSVAGLGWLDETEIDSIPGAQRVAVSDTGEIIDRPQHRQSAKPAGDGDGLPRSLDELPEMNPDGDNPFTGAEPAKPAKPVISKSNLNILHALGVAYYGNDWDAKRPVLVEKATKGSTTSSAELTVNEGNLLISGLEKRIRAEYEEIAQAAGEPADEIADLHGVKLAKALTELRARVVGEPEKVAA